MSLMKGEHNTLRGLSGSTSARNSGGNPTLAGMDVSKTYKTSRTHLNTDELSAGICMCGPV
jgi:hypothetical protein